jgi:hypothetical protein
MTTTRVRMTFPSPGRARTHDVIQALQRARDVAVNVVRGCITLREAWFDVELRGPEGPVRDAVLRTREAGVIVTAGAP